MRKSYNFLALLFTLITNSCSIDESKTNEQTPNSFEFEIIDSLIVDYLGKPQLTDISPDGEKILFFNNRNSEFIITNSEGQILSQFEKEGDIPDNPGALADLPVFLNDSSVVGYGQNGLFVYNLKGENVWKFAMQSGGYWLSKISQRNMFVFDSDRLLTIVNYDFLDQDASLDSMYKNMHGLKLVDLEMRKIQPIAYLEKESRFLDGKGYNPTSMLPNVDAFGEQLLLSYDKDTLLFIYELKEDELLLDRSFSLDVEPFYLDPGKERSSFNEREGLSFSSKSGEAYIEKAWFVNESTVLVKYNEGLPEHERREPEMKMTGENSVTFIPPDNLPESKYQLYVKGEKVGAAFTEPVALRRLSHIQDSTLYFSKDYEALDTEDNYAVFYKVIISEKK